MSLPELLILCSVVATMSVSCKKDDIELPPFPANTEVGANTFLFRVDGGDIIRAQVGFLPAVPRIEVFYNKDYPTFEGRKYFDISASRVGSGENKRITISINSLTETETYFLNSETNWASFADYSAEDYNYYTNYNHTGEVKISKVDTVNYIISGTFNFKAQQYLNFNTTTEEVITIEGQFDVKYVPNESVRYY